jgi:hypothetical protein
MIARAADGEDGVVFEQQQFVRRVEVLRLLRDDLFCNSSASP